MIATVILSSRIPSDVQEVCDTVGILPAALASGGARVVSLAPQAADLEDVFLELVS